MNDINRVTVVGRLTRDAELKYTNGGMAVCKFAIASNYRKKNGDQWTDEANFFDVVLFGKTGEAVHRYLLKGKQVGVDGELRQERWDQDGQMRSAVKIYANTVQLLGGGKQDGASSGSGDQAGAYKPAPPTVSEGAWPAVDEPANQAVFEDDVPF